VVNVPIHTRIQELVLGLEQFLVRHRTSLVLLFAYCSFFWRLYDESGKFGTAALAPLPTTLSFGHMLLDPNVSEPLTRATVLSRAKSSGRSAGVGLRRENIGRQSETAELEDPISRIERALKLVVADKDPLRRSRLLAETYTSLGRLHSAQGRYYEMLHAMALALRVSTDAGDNDTASDLHVTLGKLEMKHHRYYAAGTRFEDALASGQGSQFEEYLRGEALAGLGWAMLMQADPIGAAPHFLMALGWIGGSGQLNGSVHVAALSVVGKSGCRARFDGVDHVRVLSLAGLSLASSARRSGSTNTKNDFGSALHYLDCAVTLFHGLPYDLQEPFIWHSLGLARHAAIDRSVNSEAQQEATRRYHQRGATLNHQRTSITVSNLSLPACADLPSCSITALHSGLISFSTGNISVGMSHVEQLLSLTGEIHSEAAEWLIRFARAHAWTPAGPDFASFLLARVEPLIKSEGEVRLARHLSDYGRFLLAQKDRPKRFRRALTQLSRAREIIERIDVGWPNAEVAGFYSTLGSVLHQTGQIEEAIRSYEKALEHDRLEVASGGSKHRKRLLISHANLGALRLEVAGADPRRWRAALADMQHGRQAAHDAGLSPLDPLVKGFEASYRNARRLAHHRGVLQTCPSPLDALLYGLTCRSEPDSMQ
jgi:tetratricopeptide (TPR) repeat protein